jgi:hypothetical protein
MMERTVAEGTWLYADSVPTVVRIVQLDYDFWFAVGEANGDLDPSEMPALNPDGYLYYVRNTPWSEGEPFWPDGPGRLSVEEAMAHAETSLPNPVAWSLA